MLLGLGRQDAEAVGSSELTLARLAGGDVSASRFGQASIPVALRAEVLLVAETSDTGIPETGRDRSGVIRRGVVDDQYLEISKRLRENGVDGLPDMGGAPVCRDADRDHRLSARCVHHPAEIALAGLSVAGTLHFVLPAAIGATAIVDDVKQPELRTALKRVGFAK